MQYLSRRAREVALGNHFAMICCRPAVHFCQSQGPFRLSSQSAYLSTRSSAVPRLASPSIWASVIPKAFRQPDDPISVAERQKKKAARKSKDWNPATFFIIMALLIGSNAIQMIALKNQTRNFSRKAEAKIALLKEVIERVHKGEDVDVEGLLGTGDPEREREWDEGRSWSLQARDHIS